MQRDNINNVNVKTPKTNIKSSVLLTPNLVATLYNLIKIIFVSSNSGFVIRDIKGKIEAIPSVSNNAIVNINKNNNETLRYNPIVDTAYIRSEIVNRKDIVPNYIRGILLGLLLSFVLIFFKSLVLNRQKPDKD